MKALAAASPLSLQAHPTTAQAEAGFAREDTVSDPFTALAGFRPVAETRAVLDPVAADTAIAPLVDMLVDDSSLRDVFTWIITRGTGVDELIAAVVQASTVVDGPSWATVRTLARHFPGDHGIPISLLLHTISLTPGEVLYLPAGNIHAYLEGVGIELMAASDNVLRGGLTTKHVDVAELLDVLDFTPSPAPYLRPSTPQPGVQVFTPDVPDFVLTVVSPDAAARGVDLEIAHGGPAIALLTSGAVTLHGTEAQYTVTQGGAIYISGEPQVHISGDGLLFVASSGS
jgi:mannose-6-phosphate isomerase